MGAGRFTQERENGALNGVRVVKGDNPFAMNDGTAEPSISERCIVRVFSIDEAEIRTAESIWGEVLSALFDRLKLG